VDELVVALGC